MRNFGSGDDCVILAGPTWGGVPASTTRTRLSENEDAIFVGAVGGVIVDHDDFECDICLRDQRIEAVL